MASTRARTVVVTLALAATLGACGGGDPADRAAVPAPDEIAPATDAAPADSVGGTGVAGTGVPLTALATEAAPTDIAYVDEVGEPATIVLADDAAAVPVHSAPDRIHTRIGELGPGDAVGMTGRQVTHEGGTWQEIIWRDAMAWIPAID